MKPTFRSPIQASRDCCQLSSAPVKSHFGQGGEEDTGREDRAQPELEEAKGAARIWPKLGQRGQKLLDKDDRYTNPQTHLNAPTHASALRSLAWFFWGGIRLKKGN